MIRCGGCGAELERSDLTHRCDPQRLQRLEDKINEIGPLFPGLTARQLIDKAAELLDAEQALAPDPD